MKMLIVSLLIFVSPSAFAKDASIVLSGTVPLTAEVVIQKNNQVILKSSAGLKTQIQKRNFASIIQVSAP